MVIDASDLAKIRWRCHRGMLELDIFLLRFFDNQFQTLTVTEQQQFIALLKEQDPDLFAWLLGHREADPEHIEMINKIRDTHAKSAS